MKTISFKVSEDEASLIRRMAGEAGLNVSEFLRSRVVATPTVATGPLPRTRCEHTGAEIFATAPTLPHLTTEAVREILADFP
ncbi:plasmid mobilization protein [Haloferula sp. A504]|uniref:plasmid mobilization protein n=1 Tax=Haloferula sp. A504 TaxID=3373601 RepID=UPI0031C72A4D|nr:hypothetical protein [Verrucomicrobiaceae bacterium E54]